MNTAKISSKELIVLIAMMTKIVAFSPDGRASSLSQIAQELNPNVPKRAKKFLIQFIIGMTPGTFFVIPELDAFGSKLIIIQGLFFYIIMGFVTYLMATKESYLYHFFSRSRRSFSQDCFAGNYSKRLFGSKNGSKYNFVMTILAFLTAAAPLLEQKIISIFDWLAFLSLA